MLLKLFRYHEDKDDVDEDGRTDADDGGHGKSGPDNGGIDVEIVGNASAHPGNHPVGPRSSELFFHKRRFIHPHLTDRRLQDNGFVA